MRSDPMRSDPVLAGTDQLQPPIGPASERDLRRFVGLGWALVALVPALYAVIVVVITDDARWLRTAVVAALCAAMFGALAVLGNRGREAAAVRHRHELEQRHEQHLVRETAARGELVEHLVRMANRLADPADRQHLSEVGDRLVALGERLDGMHSRLTNLYSTLGTHAATTTRQHSELVDVLRLLERMARELTTTIDPAAPSSAVRYGTSDRAVADVPRPWPVTFNTPPELNQRGRTMVHPTPAEIGSERATRESASAKNRGDGRAPTSVAAAISLETPASSRETPASSREPAAPSREPAAPSRETPAPSPEPAAPSREPAAPSRESAVATVAALTTLHSSPAPTVAVASKPAIPAERSGAADVADVDLLDPQVRVSDLLAAYGREPLARRRRRKD